MLHRSIQIATHESTHIQPLTVVLAKGNRALTNILCCAFRRKLPDVRDGHGYVNTEVNLVKIGVYTYRPRELLPKLGLR
jgi:hypothetical protein